MPEKLDSSIVLLRERIEQGMRGSADLILDEFELAGVKGLAFMFDGLVSNTQVSDFLLRPINRMAPPEADPEKLWEYLRSQFLFSSEQGIVETYEDLFTKAMSGFAMVMLACPGRSRWAIRALRHGAWGSPPWRRTSAAPGRALPKATIPIPPWCAAGSNPPI